MSATAAPSPMSADEQAFRRQCIALGRTRNEQKIAPLLESFGESFDRDLFAKVWQEEETRSRALRQRAARFRKPFAISAALLALALLSVPMYWKAARSFISPYSVPVVGYLATALPDAFESWAKRRSPLQKGMARLLLSRGARMEEVGYLVDIADFYVTNSAEGDAYIETAMKVLTKLLPVAVQTDTLKLDAHQRGILRKQIVRVAEHLTNKKRKTPADLTPDYADFAAAALLAVNALGELRGDSKEHRAAHAAIQMLAEAAPRPDETLNHSYVREVARETLPQLHVGKGVRK